MSDQQRARPRIWLEPGGPKYNLFMMYLGDYPALWYCSLVDVDKCRSGPLGEGRSAKEAYDDWQAQTT